MAELEVNEAFNLVVNSLGTSKAGLPPEEWVDEMVAYTSALVRGYRGLHRYIKEWGDTVHIAGTIVSIQNPFVTSSGETRALAKITFRPDRTRLANATQGFWVDLSASYANDLLNRLGSLVGEHCTVIKQSRYKLDAEGNRAKSANDPTKDDTHPYVVGVTADTTSGVHTDQPEMPSELPEAAAAPVAAVPAAVKEEAEEAAPVAKAAKKAAPATKKAAPTAKAASAAKAAPATPASTTEGVPNGFASALEANEMRQQINDLVRSMTPENKDLAREWMKEHDLKWPLSKVRAQVLVDYLASLSPEAEAEAEVEAVAEVELEAVAEVDFTEGQDVDDAIDTDDTEW